jgi:hypothetical protein
MVKKIMTGLAISVGAGLAVTVAARSNGNNKKKVGWHPASVDGTMTPLNIRTHGSAPRNEQEPAEPSASQEPVAALPAPTSPETLAELAEIRVMIDTLDQRTNEMMTTVNQRIDDLQNHLPRFIDVKVTARIREVEERLRTDFQDEQSRTLDAFLKTLDGKVLPRIQLVEEAIGAQGAEIGRMHDRIEKTDETLERVLDRIEKVVEAVSPFPAVANSHVMEIHQKAVA